MTYPISSVKPFSGVFTICLNMFKIVCIGLDTKRFCVLVILLGKKVGGIL